MIGKRIGGGGHHRTSSPQIGAARVCGYISNVEAVLSVAYLCGCAVRGEVPSLSRLSCSDVDVLLSLAARHSLDGCVALALGDAGAETPASRQARGHAAFRAAALAIDEARVFDALERAGIAYCPVKGAVLEGIYPRLGMRQMSDRDILFDASRADDVRELMEGLGFETVGFGRRDADSYERPPVSNFDMHRRLFSHDNRYGDAVVDYYDAVWDRLVKDGGNGSGWHMDATEHYLYMVCHEHKHWSGCGTGLRSLLDVYVWLLANGREIDWDRAIRTAHELGLGDFEERNRELALNLFGGAELTGEQADMLARIVLSGTYGTVSNRVANGLARHGGGPLGRAAYVWGRVFPPADAMMPPGSFWEAHRWLLPLRYARRVASGLATKPGAMLGELLLALGAGTPAARTRVNRSPKS